VRCSYASGCGVSSIASSSDGSLYDVQFLESLKRIHLIGSPAVPREHYSKLLLVVVTFSWFHGQVRDRRGHESK
jgi:hypothetical protein